jgi:hypothetical protein
MTTARRSASQLTTHARRLFEVEHALQAVKSVIDTTRNPQLLSDQHIYVYDVSDIMGA